MKRLSVSILVLVFLLLCACSVQKEPVSSDLPSEAESSVSEISESGSESGSESSEEPDIPSYEDMAREIYESDEHSEYISLINNLVEQYKNGTYVEVPNHHPPYPDDFPDAKNLPEATKENVILCWKNEKRLSESMVSEGLIEYVYIIDESHAIVLEPVKFGMSDGTTKPGFANTLYLGCEIKPWISKVFEGFFGNDF